MSIRKLRAEAKNVKEFDESLDRLINLYTKQPEIDYPDGGFLFNKLGGLFMF